MKTLAKLLVAVLVAGALLFPVSAALFYHGHGREAAYALLIGVVALQLAAMAIAALVVLKVGEAARRAYKGISLSVKEKPSQNSALIPDTISISVYLVVSITVISVMFLGFAHGLSEAELLPLAVGAGFAAGAVLFLLSLCAEKLRKRSKRSLGTTPS